MKKSPNVPNNSNNTDFQRRYTLAQLLGRITPGNKHSELGWGTQVGKEIIEQSAMYDIHQK